MYLQCNQNKIKIEDCVTFFSRLKGFMFQFSPIKTGKRFPKCNSIHTFFMFQNIDVIMTDQNNKITHMFPNFKTERIILPKKNVYYTYEFPLGTCDYFQIGDYLKMNKNT